MGKKNSKQLPGSSLLPSYLEKTKTNYIENLRVLDGHENFVRVLLRLDNHRIASGSDDGKIIIWNFLSGEKLRILEGHTLKITCLLYINRVLISGSSDKSIRLWDVHTGKCTEMLKGHIGSVKCLVKLTENTFCSGGNDHLLCFWSTEGKLMHIIQIPEVNEISLCMTTMLRLPDKLIVGSNSPTIFVCNDTREDMIPIQSKHREPICSLVALSESTFASGSLDGMIAFWSCENDNWESRVLYCPPFSEKHDHVFDKIVHHLTLLNEDFLVAAVGSSFVIFDVHTGEQVLSALCPQSSNVTRIIPLFQGEVLVSSSENGNINIWGSMPSVNFSLLARGRRPEKLEARHIATLVGHSLSVLELIPLAVSNHNGDIKTDLNSSAGAYSFASSSADGLVIVWTEAEEESKRMQQSAFSKSSEYLGQYLPSQEDLDRMYLLYVEQLSKREEKIRREEERKSKEGKKQEDFNLQNKSTYDEEEKKKTSISPRDPEHILHESEHQHVIDGESEVEKVTEKRAGDEERNRNNNNNCNCRESNVDAVAEEQFSRPSSDMTEEAEAAGSSKDHPLVPQDHSRSELCDGFSCTCASHNLETQQSKHFLNGMACSRDIPSHGDLTSVM